MLRSKTVQVILLILLVTGVYASSLGGDFVFDDKAMIVVYDLVKDIKNIPAAFVSATSVYGNVNYYRPLQTVTYILDYYLWGNLPAGFHLTNVLFHILAVLLVYWIIVLLFKDRMVAFLTAIMFSIHPVHTTVVSYIAGRADAMLCVFMLACLSFYIKFAYIKKRTPYYLFSLVFFILSLLTKEFAMIIPVLIVIFDKYGWKYTLLAPVPRPLKRPGYSRYLPFLLILAAYLFFRITKMSFFVEGAIPSPPFVNRLVTAPYVLVQYLRLIILPNDLHIGRSIWLARSFFDARILVSSFILAALLLALFRIRKKERTVYFGALWFLVMITPSLNIITPLFYTIAENWLYMPSIGLFLVIAVLFRKMYEKFNTSGAFILKYMLVSVFIICIGSIAIITIRHNHTWKDEITLGLNTLKYNPREFKMYNNIGVVYLGRGELDKAEQAFVKCLEIKPDTGMAYFNLYRVYISRGNREQAIKYLNRAKNLDPQRVGILIEKMGIKD